MRSPIPLSAYAKIFDCLIVYALDCYTWYEEIRPVAARLLGQMGITLPKIFRKKFILHEGILSFFDIQQEAVAFTFLSLTLNLPRAFCMNGARSCPCGALLR